MPVMKVLTYLMEHLSLIFMNLLKVIAFSQVTLLNDDDFQDSQRLLSTTWYRKLEFKLAKHRQLFIAVAI